MVGSHGPTGNKPLKRLYLPVDMSVRHGNWLLTQHVRSAHVDLMHPAQTFHTRQRQATATEICHRQIGVEYQRQR